MADEYNQYPNSQDVPYEAPVTDFNQASQQPVTDFSQSQQQPYTQQQPYQQPYAQQPQQPYPPQGMYPPQGYPQAGSGQIGAKSKVAAGILGILLGAFGAHKFYMGWTKEALIMLLVSILTCGFGAIVMGPIGLIEGIIYLTKSDQEFYQLYEVGGKTWF